MPIDTTVSPDGQITENTMAFLLQQDHGPEILNEARQLLSLSDLDGMLASVSARRFKLREPETDRGVSFYLQRRVIH